MSILIVKIVWENFFAINCLIYYELIWEFYSTFSTASLIDCILDTVEVVKFRLMSQRFVSSLTEFNKIIGLVYDAFAHSEAYLNAYIDICDDFNT